MIEKRLKERKGVLVRTPFSPLFLLHFGFYFHLPASTQQPVSDGHHRRDLRRRSVRHHLRPRGHHRRSAHHHLRRYFLEHSSGHHHRNHHGYNSERHRDRRSPRENIRRCKGCARSAGACRVVDATIHPHKPRGRKLRHNSHNRADCSSQHQIRASLAKSERYGSNSRLRHAEGKRPRRLDTPSCSKVV